MSEARERILARLRQARSVSPMAAAGPSALPEVAIPPPERIPRFRACLEAVRALVHVTPRSGVGELLRRLVDDRAIRRLLYGADGPIAPLLRATFAGAGGTTLVSYDADIESWKEDLFYGIDAAVTSSLGGIADTGSVILWPDAAEPRLMSLVPPIHVVLVDAAQIHATLEEAMHVQRWTERMPTNALLISGPSKSADIEQTLAYGVHGPKELVVIVMTQA
jgi:L-lactate dehydrogenase complex protein LldG